MKRLFFGGSFDPPHLGHLAIARSALLAGCGDEVLWVPAFSPPHKQGCDRAPFADRMAMVQLLIAGEKAMTVSDIENRMEKSPSYTIDVLQTLETLYGEAPALLIGSDSLMNFHTWKAAEKLVDNCEIFTYLRKSALPDEDFLRRQWGAERCAKLLSGVIPGKFFEISSTEVRFSMEKNHFADNIKERTLLAPAVAEYIFRRNLYRQFRKSPRENQPIL